MSFGRCRLHHCKIIKQSEDIVIHIHSKYKLFHQKVRGLSHMCELIHMYKNQTPPSTDTNLPPWSADYKPRPSEYDLAILSNCNDYFLENFIMWKAAVARLKNRKRMREQKRKSALQQLVKIYLERSVYGFVRQDKEDKENTPPAPADLGPEDDAVPSDYSGPESDEDDDAEDETKNVQDDQEEDDQCAMEESTEEVVEEETVWDENTIQNLNVQQQLLPEEPAWDESRYEPISNQNYYNNSGIPPHYSVATHKPIAAVSPSKPKRPSRPDLGDVLGTMLPTPPSPEINVVDDDDVTVNEDGLDN